MGLPSLCAEDAAPTERVGEMGPESDVVMALMRELSCARVISPSVLCARTTETSLSFSLPYFSTLG